MSDSDKPKPFDEWTDCPLCRRAECVCGKAPPPASADDQRASTPLNTKSAFFARGRSGSDAHPIASAEDAPDDFDAPPPPMPIHGRLVCIDPDELARLRAELAAANARADALTFDHFREANVRRCLKWHPAGIESWSPSDWLVAVTGELGELASLVKMRNRERDGLPGNKFSPSQKQVADEMADVLTYLDIFAASVGVDLGAAVVEKFNEVSERVGFPDRIDAARRKP